MARPTKIGLDYFPLDVIIDDDVLLLEAEHGLVGFSILIKLWQKIYSVGYFIEWKDDNVLLFAKSINTEITIVNDVINTCLRRNIFNESLHKQYGILTSRGIQKRYFKVCQEARRTRVTAIDNYFLLNKLEFQSTFIEFTHEESTQSKVKEIKEEKKSIIVKQSFDEGSFEMNIVDSFIKHLKVLNPKLKEPNKQKWADEIRKMLYIDNRSEQDIIDVCKFAVNDSFWQTTILSTSKLRKQFDQLYVKSHANSKRKEVATEWDID